MADEVVVYIFQEAQSEMNVNIESLGTEAAKKLKDMRTHLNTYAKFNDPANLEQITEAASAFLRIVKQRNAAYNTQNCLAGLLRMLSHLYKELDRTQFVFLI